MSPSNAARDARQIVATRAGDLGVIVRGEGPDVVLLHGVTDNATTWLPVQRVLEKEARLHAIDLPGHGHSYIPPEPLTMAAMADAVIGYLDEAGIRDAVVVGNSLGGGVALGVCARAPARIRSALLLGTTGAPFRLEFGVRLIGRPWMARTMVRIASHSWLRRAVVRRGFPFRYRPTEEMVANYWEGWTMPGRPEYMSALMRVLDVGEPLPWLPAIAQRVHVMHGTRDRVVPMAAATRVARTLPNATLTVLRGVSHLPQHDATAAVTTALRELLSA